jgi:hypothetical protein
VADKSATVSPVRGDEVLSPKPVVASTKASPSATVSPVSFNANNPFLAASPGPSAFPPIPISPPKAQKAFEIQL